jgi:chemotaxis protein histidine kinase CheA
MSDSARIIRPNLTLNSKVTVGGPGAVDEAMLEKAEQVIQSMSEDYLKWAKDDLTRLAKAFAVLKAAGGQSPDTAQQLDAIFSVSHDIKGQGGSFDYQLMTIVGNQLCRFIENLAGKADANAIEVIELHVNALQAVMAHKLKGDGGAIGKKFLAGLEQVIAKRTVKPSA